MPSEAELAALRTIIDVQQAIIDGELTADAVMHTVVARAVDMTNGTGAVVELAEGEEMVYAVASGSLSGTEGTRLAIAGSLSGLAVRSREVLTSEDTHTDDRVDPAAVRKVGARSMVVIPLLADGRAVGVLKVVSTHPSAFTEIDIAKLSVLANFAARILQHAQRFDQRMREHDLYELISQTSSDVVMQISLDGTIAWVSQSCSELLGYAPEDLVGRRNVDLVLEGYRDTFTAMARSAAESGADARWELPCVTADGRTVWVESAGRLVCDTTGRPQHRIVRLRDITQAHRERLALQASEQLFRTTLANAPIAMCLIAPDGTFLDVNAALCALLGRSPRELMSLTWQELTHASDVGKDAALVQQVLDGAIDRYRIVKRYLRPSGEIVWGDLSVSCVRDDEHQVVHFISQIVDITETVRREADAEQAVDHYERMVNYGADVLLQIDADAALTWISPNAERLFGRAADSADGSIPTDLIDEAYRDRVDQVLADMRTGPVEGTYEFPIDRADGTRVWVEAVTQALTDAHGAFDGHVVRVHDITRLVEQRARLETKAITDPLTGLITRDEAERRIRALVEHPPRTGLQTLVAFVDVDGLKAVNDDYGHDAGDELLRTVAVRMQALLREGDIVARIGGDEMLLILSGIRAVDDGLDVLRRLQVSVSRPHAYGPITLEPRVSIGVTRVEAEDDADEILKRADAAMYAVKRAGGGDVQLATT